MNKTIRHILTLSLIYLVGINLIVLITASNLFISTTNHSLKELLFSFWGYGWDGWHYLSIAKNGYHFPNQAFFPLYPLLLRGLNYFLPLNAAYRINVLLLPLLLILLYKLLPFLKVKKEHRILALIALLFFPTSYFLQASYTETLFIIGASLTFLFLFKGKYWVAAVVAGLMTALRSNGIVLAPIVVLSFIRSTQSSLTKAAAKALGLGMVAMSGLLVYFYYLQQRFGSCSIFFKAHAEWLRSPGNPFLIPQAVFGHVSRVIQSFIERPTFIGREHFELAFFMFGVYLLVIAYKKMRWELYLFSLLQFLLPLSSGSLLSLPRLLLLCFPLILYFGATRLRRPYVLASYLFLATLLQTLMVLMFFNNTFIA